VIKQQLADGVKTRRVGFVSKGAPARAHSEIQTPDGETVRVLRPQRRIAVNIVPQVLITKAYFLALAQRKQPACTVLCRAPLMTQ